MSPIAPLANFRFEHADYVRVSTLRQYLEALGARLELVAVFETTTAELPCIYGDHNVA